MTLATDHNRRATTANQAHPARLQPRGAMTLVELLVVIVILVTVLGGVIPMISPNNEARKIREAARQLNTMFAQAQAQAARDGRSVGVAFREYQAGTRVTGMAIEAFFIAEPQPFAGFSESSRARVNLTGGNYVDDPGTQYHEKFLEHLGKPLAGVTFEIAGGTVTPDEFPSNFLHIGDIIEVEGNQFLIVDDDDSTAAPNETESSDPLVQTAPLIQASAVRCVWMNGKGQALAGIGGTPPLLMYSIRRQPRNTPGEPLQFPAGIGIDLEASGARGMNLPNDYDDLDSNGPTVVGIMFGPNGSLGNLYLDSVRKGKVKEVFLLLGRVENGNDATLPPADREAIYDFAANPTTSDDELAERRSQLNWLNADSRWVGVHRSGRVVTTENNVFDPNLSPYIDEPDPDKQQNAQLAAARQYAADSSSEGGR